MNGHLYGYPAGGGIVISKWLRPLLIACAVVSVGGCSAHPGPMVATPGPTAVSPAIAAVTISAADIERCGDASITSRINDALSRTRISSGNSLLALPQDLGNADLAGKQLAKWNSLTSSERAYQLCFNYQQGSFGASGMSDE